jgi:sugar phosphate permease
MLIGAQVAGNVYNRFLAGAAALTLPQWRSFWWIPASFAAVILLFFVAAFRDRPSEEPVRAVPGGAQPRAARS